MLYAVLKSIHLLSFVAWVGGMFFTLVCLRPALAVLEGPQRLRLMAEVLRRFLAVVGHAIGLMVLSGAGMLVIVSQATPGSGFSLHIPHAWYAMITLGLTMAGIYGHLRSNVFRRFQAAVEAQDAPAAGAALGQFRGWVLANLAIAAVIVLVMRLSGTM
jgi:uncharacterized membrane protein